MPPEYTAVIQLVNQYIAIHYTSECGSFIMERPSVDIKVAQTAAKLFADTHQIFYEDSLLFSDRPFLTVIKYAGAWYPAALKAKQVSLFTELGLDTEEQAIALTGELALLMKLDNLGSLGITAHNDGDVV